jgi:hypothetical protein
METSWQNNNCKSRQLISLILSVLIMLMILQIPIDYRFGVYQLEKLIAVNLIKNISPNISPKSIQPSPLRNTIETKTSVLPEVGLVESKRQNNVNAIAPNDGVNHDTTTYNSQIIENRSVRGEKFSSVKPQKQVRGRERGHKLDLESEVNTDSTDSYNHQLLNDRKKKRLAFLNEVTKDLLETRQSKLRIEIPLILEGPPSLMSIKDSESTSVKMKYCKSLGRKSVNCPAEL